jgi:branched-chain amino acid transport system substrate-binding protein
MGTIPFAPPTSPVAGHKDADEFLKGQGKTLEDATLHYTQGWWTMATMTEGIRRVIKDGKEVNGENIRAALEGMQNFSTGDVTTPINFSATSHKGNNALKLFKVEGGKWIQVSDFISAK